MQVKSLGSGLSSVFKIIWHRRSFKNAKISVRLGLLVSFLGLLMIVSGGLGLLALDEAEKELNDLFTRRLEPIQTISSIQIGTLKIRALLLDSIIQTNESEDATEILNQIQTVLDKINSELQNIDIDEGDPELSTLWDKYKTTRFAYGTGTMFPIIEAIRNKDADEAVMIQSVSGGEYDKLESAVDEMVKYQLAEASHDIENSIKKNESYRVYGVSVIIGGLMLAALFSIFIIRGVVIPLARAVKLANHVANGNLTYTIHVDSYDETGQMLRALSAMNVTLQNIVSDVHREVESINESAINVADSSHMLADRINQESITLDLTTSHMESVVTTNQNAADSAAKAQQLAESARKEAIAGGLVTDKAVSAMNTISNSSVEISDITDTIDSIAFQTNLLALNASVEAARAGEQGRGFAVVADEVRVLSKRAATASKEIKDLIYESVEYIKIGKEHVDQSGQALVSIQSIIHDVADIVKNINMDSKKQTAGIDDINKYISEIHANAKQNASTVINSAVASNATTERVSTLLRLMRFFKLKESSNIDKDQNASVSSNELEPPQPLRLN